MRLLNSFILLLIATLLLSCSAEQKAARKTRKAQHKLNKLLKENPELVKTDSIMKDTIIPVPAIKDSATAIFKSDSGAINAIIDNAKLPISDSAKQALKDSLNKFEESRERDTTIISSQGIKFHIREKGNKITVEIEKKGGAVKFRYAQAINKVSAAPELSRMDKIKKAIARYVMTTMLILFLLLILYVAYKIAKARFFS